MRNIQAFNVAMLAKNSWRILTKPTCLLARLLLGKYCSNSDFFSTSCSSSASHGWKGVVAGCQLLKIQLGKAIGNGETTKIWEDSWIFPSHRFVPFGPPSEESSNYVVKDLLVRDTAEWNRPMVDSLLPELAADIYLIRHSTLQTEDKFCWHKMKSGSYSVKSGYYAWQEESTNPQLLSPTITDFNWKKFVWQEETAPNQQIFPWKLCRNALPLGTNLQIRGISTPGTCPHCFELETIASS